MQSFQNLLPGDLDKVVVERHGGAAACLVGLIATWYFRRASYSKLTPTVAHLIRDYCTSNAGYLKWVLPSGGGIWCEYNPGIAEEIIGGLELNSGIDYFDFAAHSGSQADDAGHFSCKAYVPMKSRCDEVLGFLSITFPVSWAMRQEKSALKKLVLKWSEELRAYHGYAGLGFIRNPDYFIARKAERYIFSLVQRFPGIEFDEPVSHARLCRHGIKGINWLTVVSDDLLSLMGGRGVVYGKVDASQVVIHPYKYGLMLQAGAVPQLGDNEKGIRLPSYATVFECLQAVRAKYEDTLIETPSGVSERAFTRAWLNRFDGT